MRLPSFNIMYFQSYSYLYSQCLFPSAIHSIYLVYGVLIKLNWLISHLIPVPRMSGSQNLPPFRVQYHGPKGAPPVEIDKSNNEDANLQADLTVYGFWVSQPTRSVLWTLMIHDIPFRFVTVNPLKKETQRPEYLAINPLGKVPVLLVSCVFPSHFLRYLITFNQRKLICAA